MPGKFNTSSKKAPAKKKRASRYGGIKAEGDRPPFLGMGSYRLRVTRFEEGEYIERSAEDGGPRRNVSADFEVVAIDAGADAPSPDHSQGDAVSVIFRVEGGGSRGGRSRLKGFAVAAAGYEEEDDFDAVADGDLLDALLGFAVDHDDVDDSTTLLGRLVDVRGSRGGAIKRNDVATGEYYTNHEWAPVADEEQEEASE